MDKRTGAGCWLTGSSLLTRSLWLLALGLGPVLVAAACGETESAPDTPTPSYTGEPEDVMDGSTPSYTGEQDAVQDTTAGSGTPDVEAPDPEEAQTGDDDSAVLIMSDLIPEFHGAGTPSLEERIYDSDVVVRACLLSAAGGVLRFRAIEYLRGAGTDEFIVKASTRIRNKKWDTREAVLFLVTWTGGTTTRSSESPTVEFLFAETDKGYTGQLPEGYTIDTRNPVWLPAASESGTTTSGTDRASGPDSEVITDLHSPTGTPYPTVSLAELRAKIAWIEGGEDTVGYDRCIRYALDYLRFYRDFETYYGREWEPYQTEAQVASGVEEGTVIGDYGIIRGEGGYGTFSLTDPDSSDSRDAGLFSSLIVDDDDMASNGYSRVIATARPLPSGKYRFVDHVRGARLHPVRFPYSKH